MPHAMLEPHDTSAQPSTETAEIEMHDTVAAQTGEVLNVPMSRAQAVLLERAAKALEESLSSVKGSGLARELRGIAQTWRGAELAATQEEDRVIAAQEGGEEPGDHRLQEARST